MNKDDFKKACDAITAEIEETRKGDSSIVYDGVIDPEKYLEASPKILWILKEANSDPDEGDWSYPDNFKSDRWLNDKKCAAISSIKRVMYASYGMLYGMDKQWSEFPWYYEKECQQSLRDIAFINIKKTPGGSTSDDREIQSAYDENRELILRQVDTYAPDVVVFGGTLKYFDRARDFADLRESDVKYSEFNNHYYYGDNRLYIYAYHPACRGGGFTDFGYVMDIVNIFREWKKSNGIPRPGVSLR